MNRAFLQSLLVMMVTTNLKKNRVGLLLKVVNVFPVCAQQEQQSLSHHQPQVMPLFTEDYIKGINQIDLGPRVNDLSKL